MALDVSEETGDTAFPVCDVHHRSMPLTLKSIELTDTPLSVIGFARGTIVTGWTVDSIGGVGFILGTTGPPLTESRRNLWISYWND